LDFEWFSDKVGVEFLSATVWSCVFFALPSEEFVSKLPTFASTQAAAQFLALGCPIAPVVLSQHFVAGFLEALEAVL
jgi:hypothetical protein